MGPVSSFIHCTAEQVITGAVFHWDATHVGNTVNSLNLGAKGGLETRTCGLHIRGEGKKGMNLVLVVGI